MSDPTTQAPPNEDADKDGMPDVVNARMPAVSFVTAMLALVPTLFGVRASLEALRGVAEQRTMAFVYNCLAASIATGAIVGAAYGARATTKVLANGGRWIGISVVVVSLLLIVILFFKN
ncbi:MAG: hypothetical protein WCJ30_12240 [Deltaproteobacteria bacterium]